MRTHLISGMAKLARDNVKILNLFQKPPTPFLKWWDSHDQNIRPSGLNNKGMCSISHRSATKIQGKVPFWTYEKVHKFVETIRFNGIHKSHVMAR